MAPTERNLKFDNVEIENGEHFFLTVNFIMRQYEGENNLNISIATDLIQDEDGKLFLSPVNN